MHCTYVFRCLFKHVECEWAIKKRLLPHACVARKALCVCLYFFSPGKLFPLTRASESAFDSQVVDALSRFHIRSWRAIFAAADTVRGNNRNNYFHFPWWCRSATSNGPRNYNVQINISAGHNILLPVK